MFKRIVLAFDGSDHAKRAFDVAVELALKYGAALEIVQVVTHQQAPEEIAAFARAERVENPEQIELAKCAANSLSPLASRAKKLGVKKVAVEVLRGEPAVEMLDYAKSAGADLIVMGRRGRGRVSGLMLGSVSAKLAGTADCAVLTVK
jgi:nucleotide-binding universal stress UspA family protein